MFSGSGSHLLMYRRHQTFSYSDPSSTPPCCCEIRAAQNCGGITHRVDPPPSPMRFSFPFPRSNEAPSPASGEASSQGRRPSPCELLICNSLRRGWWPSGAERRQTDRQTQRQRQCLSVCVLNCKGFVLSSPRACQRDAQAPKGRGLCSPCSHQRLQPSVTPRPQHVPEVAAPAERWWGWPLGVTQSGFHIMTGEASLKL